MPQQALLANVDADLLKQAAINVIQNGAQAMPEGGRLDVVLEEDHGSALLRIADEGSGIPEEIREKIFDLYFTTRSAGSGIGLAMTYRIQDVARSSCCAFRSPPRNGDAGIFRRRALKVRRGQRDEVACQNSCVPAAVHAHGVLSQDDPAAGSDYCSAPEGNHASQAHAHACRASSFRYDDPRPAPTGGGHCASAGNPQTAPKAS
jgi:hypothetical protein